MSRFSHQQPPCWASADVRSGQFGTPVPRGTAAAGYDVRIPSNSTCSTGQIPRASWQRKGDEGRGEQQVDVRIARPSDVGRAGQQMGSTGQWQWRAMTRSTGVGQRERRPGSSATTAEEPH